MASAWRYTTTKRTWCSTTPAFPRTCGFSSSNATPVACCASSATSPGSAFRSSAPASAAHRPPIPRPTCASWACARRSGQADNRVVFERRFLDLRCPAPIQRWRAPARAVPRPARPPPGARRSGRTHPRPPAEDARPLAGHADPGHGTAPHRAYPASPPGRRGQQLPPVARRGAPGPRRRAAGHRRDSPGGDRRAPRLRRGVQLHPRLQALERHDAAPVSPAATTRRDAPSRSGLIPRRQDASARCSFRRRLPAARLAVHARHPVARQRRHLRWQRRTTHGLPATAWPAHAPEQVEAEVNYIRDNGQRPVAYTYPAPAGRRSAARCCSRPGWRSAMRVCWRNRPAWSARVSTGARGERGGRFRG